MFPAPTLISRAGKHARLADVAERFESALGLKVQDLFGFYELHCALEGAEQVTIGI
jgi:hypothetical protein